MFELLYLLPKLSHLLLVPVPGSIEFEHARLHILDCASAQMRAIFRQAYGFRARGHTVSVQRPHLLECFESPLRFTSLTLRQFGAQLGLLHPARVALSQGSSVQCDLVHGAGAQQKADVLEGPELVRLEDD